MITVRVHRRPVLEAPPKATPIRTRKYLETLELRAEYIKGSGVWVYFPFNDDRQFTKAGVGRGRMKDWVIDPEDLILLFATTS